MSQSCNLVHMGFISIFSKPVTSIKINCVNHDPHPPTQYDTVQPCTSLIKKCSCSVV